MEHYRKEHIEKMQREAGQRRAEFEDQLTKLFTMLVGNINPARKPRWTSAEIIQWTNYMLRTPFFGLLDSYRMIRGEYIIELVGVRTYRLRVHYYSTRVMPYEMNIEAKRPDRATAFMRLAGTLKAALVEAIRRDQPGFHVTL